MTEVRVVLVLGIVLAGCVRAGFDSEPPGSDSRPADGVAKDTPGGSADAPSAARRCIPLTETWTLENPTLVSGPSSTAMEGEVTLSADGMTLFFAATSTADWDSYRATRPDLITPFGAGVPQSGINTGGAELRFLLTPDGLTAFLNAERGGGVGLSDLWVATRDSTTIPFTSAAFSLLPNVNTDNEEYDPWVSTDGLRLYFARGPSNKDLDLYLAERGTPSAQFSAGTRLQVVNSTFIDDNPTLTDDELVLVFASKRPGGSGVKSLWYAVRTDRATPFSTPKPLPVVNSSAEDSEPWIHTSTCELFFVSSRQGGIDIYRSRFISP